MPKVEYVAKRFNAASESRIVEANEIISEFAELGFSLTLRQLYYQFVARGLIENSQKSYKRLGELISNARLAGLIDWGAIEDRTRSVRGRDHWDFPADIVRDAAGWYCRDLWEDQDYRDREAWEAEIATEDEHKEQLSRLANNYDRAIDAIADS